VGSVVLSRHPDGLHHPSVGTRSWDERGLDNRSVVGVIQSLTSGDFEKSMTSLADHRVWQDVYKPVHGDRMLCVKFTRDARQALLLISFKEA
jgi:motility quorum-sensing regulator/GCU-specific mRNA interferase toxin